MTMPARRAAALLACAAFGFATSAFAQDKTIKIGVLNDMSSLYADIGGPNSVAAVKMAVEDSGLKAKGWTIEVLSGDHQNKPDIGVNIARQWIDADKVDAIADTPSSGVALAVSNLVKEKNAVLLNSGAATADLTGKACTPNTVSFTYDTYMLANGTGKALTKAGGDSWFFLTADYAFGHALERDTGAVVTATGGKVLGGVKHPLNTADFSSFLLQAQSSKAKIIGLANAGGDTTNAIKQAAEFGIVQGGQKLAALLLFINDVHSLGLKTAQGLTFTESFYWDLNDQTREWSKRFQKVSPKGSMPSMTVAGLYAEILHYLKAMEALGSNPRDGAKVVAKMKELPTDDPLFGKGPLRQDGRRLIPAYLFEVKKPEESKGPWDYYKLVATIAPEDAAKPLKDSDCPLVKK
ncbi:ABC transporter substrate-binding protein [Bradyrhizobium sp. IC3069]|uniref:Amino acid/amide ABC transporter substrate-binding protein, HAAT family n=2 Tax=Bradyrhizobium yuanmingense TaxID=108015 RepID=A0A1C3VQL4_9BRAD|nr:ABC transporter substrate-binding protein [Bradyrhizobium sp. IC4059]MCA1372512.1 ABC transporter substrate-binding protein [Bradyrhizobium sp. IC4060]MCA1389033.1 ABC transporter substrate-binding protein [Bradyrhizobium sp. IC3123]MCA1410416.1 ABC transporter substrate-binding protein [Bradyrhizobium sp. NBAIM20]MCA1426058.1 ABC transporter substrate-binding protein [Bradyrhizobium sp. NBAIM16]MCA1432600.1 ABC transporter substrate-binding protein [Bradyrhizobium sp. BRP20]MCA1460190.1 A